MKNIPAQFRIGKVAIKVIFKALIFLGMLVMYALDTQVLAQETGTKQDQNNQNSFQDRFNFSAGVGLPEILNVGVCFYLDPWKFGLYLGAVPWLDRDKRAMRIMTADARYHFGGSSQLSTIPPWYMKLGFIYHRIQDSEWKYSEEHSYWLATRIGRNFNLTEQFGIFLELGPIFCLYDKFTMEDYTDIGCEYKMLPGFGIGLFYSF